MNRLADEPDILVSDRLKLTESDEKGLMRINATMGLGLDLEELIRLRNYFKHMGREPSEVELQAMGQAWSEHCCYKSSKLYLKKYLSGLRTEYTVLAMEDDAGVVQLENDLDYVVKMESHNHPSAVEPYGGAATGVGGILRDVLCMGAQPVGIIDSLYLGDGSGKVPEGYLNTRFTIKNIVGGIRDYGNRVGIPTVSGSLFFGSQFDGIPLVNAGCVGIMKDHSLSRSRVSSDSDILVLAGGKTGRDGIHGVNFASRDLQSGDSESRRAVQLGNPIIKEPLIKAVLEANEKGLILGMKDLGGGGLSSAAGEMCLAGGSGGEIDLGAVILKEEGMRPWEIWVSESQERMLIATDREKLPALQNVFESWGILNSVIGRAVKGKRMRLIYKGEEVMNLSLNFLTSGPVYSKPFKKQKKEHTRMIYFSDPSSFSEEIIKVIKHPNCAGKFPVIRQYDYTVRGNTVVKPFTGHPNMETHSDASLLRVSNESEIGIGLSSSSSVIANSIDAYTGTLWTMSRILRNLLSSGCVPHSVVDALNFGNPDHMEIMGQIDGSLRAIGDFCRYFNLPVVAGNVSLYNNVGNRDIPPTPNILIIGKIQNFNNSRTSEFKEHGSIIYLIGYSHYSLSGSVYSVMRGSEPYSLEPVNLEELQKLSKLLTQPSLGDIVLASHDVSEGGLSTAILEMAFGSSIGFKIDIADISPVRLLNKLFSEAGNRFILEVDRSKESEFEEKFKGVYHTKIGETGGNRAIIVNDAVTVLDEDISRLREYWSTALDVLM